MVTKPFFSSPGIFVANPEKPPAPDTWLQLQGVRNVSNVSSGLCLWEISFGELLGENRGERTDVIPYA